MRRVLAFLKDVFSEPCTLFPNKWGEHDLSPYCEEHDYFYSHVLDVTKWQADEYLWYRVFTGTGNKALADVMFWGVYICGWPAWWSRRVKYQFMWGR